MALIEPLVGHLLSQYAETVNEGFDKICKNAEKDVEFTVAFLSHPQAVQAMKSCLAKPHFTVAVLETLSTLIEACERPLPPSSASSTTRGQQRGARLHAIREFCSGPSFAVVKRGLSVLSDATLPVSLAALRFLTLAATHAPKMVRARFGNKPPLHLACFRAQLPYSQRRIRLSRLTFLLQLAECKGGAGVGDVMCAHGFLTSLFEDAAEVLQEGTAAGLAAGRAALRLFQVSFITSPAIAAAEKRSVLLAQRNIFRLLVKALDVPHVAEEVAEVMYHMVTELAESPCDYASSRVEAADGRGMPNYVVFFLLRQLRPNVSALASRLVLFILTTVPELVRPYFTRVSGHLSDEGGLLQRVAPSTARTATLNLMTRAFMTPIPYHLRSRRATLVSVSAASTTFYAMSPRDVVDEVCPQWIAEYVHRVINGSSNLMTLALAVQLTEAALARARVVLALVAEMQREQMAKRQQSGFGAVGGNEEASGLPTTTTTHGEGDAAVYPTSVGRMDLDDVALFTSEDAQEAAEDYNARVRAQLLSALPRREEFWHRMTQQLQPMLVELHRKRTAAGEEASKALDETSCKALAKVEFVYQRMLLLMSGYTDVFGLRVSWHSAVPTFLPSFPPPSQRARSRAVAADGPTSAIGAALNAGNDVLVHLSPASISALCALLVSAMARGVAMPKLHHITMSNAKGGAITEWPPLLSLLLWAAHRRRELGKPSAAANGTHEAIAWVARVVQWVVHSVTVRQGIHFTEALLWVLHLDAEATPCFVHMLNSLLQRSLSKAADRVAVELRGASGDGGASSEGGAGLLLAASDAFVTRTEEKRSAKVDGGDAAGVAAGRQGEGGSAAKRKESRVSLSAATGSPPPVELWVEHLHACLPAYRAVMRKVAASWQRREALVSEQVLVPLRSAQTTGRRSCGRAALFSLSTALSAAAESVQPRLLHHRLLARPPAHEQLVRFSRTLANPLCATESGESVDDSEVGVSAEERELLSRLRACRTEVVARLARTGAPRSPDATPPTRWCHMAALCWTLAGRLLAELNEAVHRQAAEVLAELHGDAQALLRAIAAAEGTLTVVLADMTDVDSLGFFTLLLCATRVDLVAGQALASLRQPGEAVPLMERTQVAALERVVLASYRGSLATPDRVRYAVLLSLHYQQKLLGSGEPAAAAVGQQRDESESEMDGSHTSQSDEGDASEAEGSDGEEAREADGADERPRSVPRRSNRRGGASARFFTRAEVPSGLQAHRFLIAQHVPASYMTPEADMLSYLVGSLTEREIQTQALACPARLHNDLRCFSRPHAKAAPDNGLDLLLSVFPEMTTGADVGVAKPCESTAAAILDPRYMLPLLHVVAALPGSRYRYLPSRYTPVLVRALSFTDVALRRYAMCALITVAHVPQQHYATPEGTPSYAASSSRRIIASFARLKMVQLAERHDPSPARGTRGEGREFIPRLPGPLSAFLVLATDPLTAFDSALHNHLVTFLIDPRTAFATPVPFASWLSSFPLDAVGTQLMLRQQQEAQRSHAMVSSSIAQSSAEEAMAELRRNMPPQLDFVCALIEHACGTTGDAVALLQSESLERLMLLCDLVTSSSELRHQFLRCLTAVCATSVQVAALLALRSTRSGAGGGVLPWLLSLLGELHREYGAEVPRYSEALYTDCLRLVRLLSFAITADRTGAALAAPARHSALIGAQLRVLRQHLLDVHVTAKEVLDLANDCVDAWGPVDYAEAAASLNVPAVDRRRGDETERRVRPPKRTSGAPSGKRPRAASATSARGTTPRRERRATVETQ